MPEAKADILIAGVGGQGTILAGRIIAAVGLREKLDVKTAETHGMAQRGGSVITHVRLGEKIYSPLIPRGDAGIILAFEQLEALRWLPWLAADGSVIVNEQVLEPLPVLTGQYAYPAGIVDELRAGAGRVIALQALELEPAKSNPRTMNTLLLGVLARLLPFPRKSWMQVIGELIPPKLRAVNEQAFAVGWAYHQSRATD